MALEKLVVIDKIEVLQDGQMQIRKKTSVLEDGKELSYTYHRWVLAPDADLTDQEDKVKKVAEAVWTDKVKLQYKSKQDELKR